MVWIKSLGHYLRFIPFWAIYGPKNTCFPVLLYLYYNTNKYKCCPTVLITCINQFMYGLNQVRGVFGPLFVIYCILGHFWVPIWVQLGPKRAHQSIFSPRNTRLVHQLSYSTNVVMFYALPQPYVAHNLKKRVSLKFGEFPA